MKTIKEMTLKEKLGQLVMCGFEDGFYDEHIRVLVEEYKVGNVIYFARNVDNIKQLANLNKKVYEEIVKNTGIIPFVGIDQEGGMVTRIMEGATFAPGAMTISATGKVEYANKIGHIMGDELANLGINFNLAPSLDTNNNALNPVIGVRSYSDDPNKVALFGTNYIKGLQDEGIIATAKHFPGHGDTNVDSHLGLPRISHDKEHVEKIELVPFKKAIKEGVKAIMTAHIIFDCYDDVPCTLSYNVLTRLLRQELGFDGIIISDCMQMKAIDNLYTTTKGVVMAIKNGLDIACISHSLEKQVDSLKALEQAVLNGEISEKAIDEKVERILKLKSSIEKQMYDKFLNRSEDDIVSYFNNLEDNKKFARKVVEESVTLVKGKNFNLKEQLNKGRKVLVIGTSPYATTIAEDELNPRSILDNIKKEVKDVDTLTIESNPVDIESVVNKAKEYDILVFLTYNINSFKNQGLLLQNIINLKKELYVVATRNPFDFLNFKDVDNFSCMYEYTPASVSAFVKYFKGEIDAKGILPVVLEKRFPICASIYVGLEDYKLEDNINYLYKLKSKGIDTVFISAHMMEAGSSFEYEFKEVVKKAKEIGVKTIIDVNKTVFDSMKESGLSDNVYSFRLDYGFTNQDILNLIENGYHIELNASTLSKRLIGLLDFLKENDCDMSMISISHNFYPKRYTGLSFEDVKSKNDILHNYGLKVSVYIPSSVNKRMPIYLGLPTIEDQRFNDLTATLSELVIVGADIVTFGDAFVSEEEMDEAINYRYDCLPIPIKLNYEASEDELKALNKLHSNRLDNSPYMIRSSNRCENIKPRNTVKRVKGDVTIDNELYKRYSGEVGIALKEMEKEDGVNVIGHVLCNDYLIDNIKPGQKFRFVIKK